MAVTSRTALIAGAGIGGLAAGLALRRAGWTVRLFERASSPRELGFDLMLASNAMAALQELGVAERVRATAAIVESMSVTAGPGARPRRGDLAPVPRSLRPLIVPMIVPRHGLHGALLEAMGAESITFGALAVDFSVDRTASLCTSRTAARSTAMFSLALTGWDQRFGNDCIPARCRTGVRWWQFAASRTTPVIS